MYGYSQNQQAFALALRPKFACARQLAQQLTAFFRTPAVRQSRNQLLHHFKAVHAGPPLTPVKIDAPEDLPSVLALGHIAHTPADLAPLSYLASKESGVQSIATKRMNAAHPGAAAVQLTVHDDAPPTIVYLDPARIEAPRLPCSQRALPLTLEQKTECASRLCFWKFDLQRNRYAAAQQHHVFGFNPSTHYWNCYMCTLATSGLKRINKWAEPCPGWPPLVPPADQSATALSSAQAPAQTPCDSSAAEPPPAASSAASSSRDGAAPAPAPSRPTRRRRSTTEPTVSAQPAQPSVSAQPAHPSVASRAPLSRTGPRPSVRALRQ